MISKAEDAFAHRIRLQKFVLLAKFEFGYPFIFDYESYYYGPYSFDLQNLVSELVEEGFLEEQILENNQGGFMYKYKLTGEGELFLKKDKPKLSERRKIDKTWSSYINEPTSFIVERAKEISGLESKNG